MPGSLPPAPCRRCGSPLDPAYRFCATCGEDSAQTGQTGSTGPGAGPTAGRPASGPPCPSCGRPHAGGVFCQFCGVVIASGPPGPPAPSDEATLRQVPPPRTLGLPPPVEPPAQTPVPQPPVPPARGRRPVAWAVAAVLVVLLGGAGVLVLLSGSGEDPAVDAVSDVGATTRTPGGAPSSRGGPTASGPATVPSTPSTTGTPSAGGTPKGTESPSAQQTPSQTTTGSGLVACWQGPSRPSIEQCPVLAGADALAWVFYGVDVSGCVVHDVPTRLYLECVDAEGDRMYNLSQWPTFAKGRAHYKLTPGGASTSISGGRLRWDGDSLTDRGEWKSAFMYRNLRWGVTVYGATRAEREARAGAVHMRKVGKVRRFS